MEFKKFTAGIESYGLDEVIEGSTDTFYDPKVQQTLEKLPEDDEKREQLIAVLLLLAACHTVIVNPKNGTYNASSPDELSLVNGAKQLGFEFIQKDEKNNIII